MTPRLTRTMGALLLAALLLPSPGLPAPSFTAKAAAANPIQRDLDFLEDHYKNRELIPTGDKIPKNNRHLEAQEWIIRTLKQAGVPQGQIVKQSFKATHPKTRKSYEGTNIVVTLPGKQTDKQIVVGAHYDGDGYGDNGSGVALLLNEIKELHKTKLPYPVKAVFFDAEEVGMLGSEAYVKQMNQTAIKQTVFMINIDAIAFGDYPNLYGGVQNDEREQVEQTSAYDLAVQKAKEIGIRVYTTAELDGYFKKNGKGPAVQANTLYTNPWTYANPSPLDEGGYPRPASPSTLDWSDHAPFKRVGIPYLYLEATNWFAEGSRDENAYSGYYETTNAAVGRFGMVMNTEFDTKATMQRYFPGRSQQHLELYSKLLTKLLKEPQPSAGKTKP